MVSIVSQNKMATIKYINVESQTPDSMFRFDHENNTNGMMTTPSPPLSPPILSTSPPYVRKTIRGLRITRIPRRERYYTDDYILTDHCEHHYHNCDNIQHRMDPSSIMIPSALSPRSTISTLANKNNNNNNNNNTDTRLSRFRILGTIRNYQSSTKQIVIDDHHCRSSNIYTDYDDNDDARSSQSYIRSSSSQKQIENKVAELELHEARQQATTTITPKTSDTRTTPNTADTPICYQMTMDDNPFMSSMVQPPTPPLFTSNDKTNDPMVNPTLDRDKKGSDEVVVGNNYNDCDSSCTMSSTSSSSTVSSMSYDSARRYNIMTTASMPLFPPLEIICYHHHHHHHHQRAIKRGTKAKHQHHDHHLMESNTASYHNSTWYSTWVKNAVPLSQLSNNIVITQPNSRPPCIQTNPVDTISTKYAPHKLNAPKNIVRREVPVRCVNTLNNNDQLPISPIYSKTLFKPIREIEKTTERYDDDDDEDKRSSLTDLVATLKTNASNDAVPVISSAASHNNVNTIFRIRSLPQHYEQHLSQNATLQRPSAICKNINTKRAVTTSNVTTTSINRVKNGTKSFIPTKQHRQFKRISMGTMVKPMTIHIPCKSLPNAEQISSPTRCIAEISIANPDSSFYHNNDPLLRNIPRRRVSHVGTTKSVFSFGSIVGQSTTTTTNGGASSIATTTKVDNVEPESESFTLASVSLQSYHTPPILKSLPSMSTPPKTTATIDQRRELPEIIDRPKSKIHRTKTTPFHGIDYYWKQTKKRLSFTTTSTTTTNGIEKPNPITSLQRNTSGCLA